MVTGCGLFRVTQDIWRMERAVELHGEVVNAAPGTPVVIMLVRHHRGKKKIWNYSVQYGPGSYRFLTTPGAAYLFAFEDRNEDLRYQEGEPAAWYGGTTPLKVIVKDGGKAENLVIRLSNEDYQGMEQIAPPEEVSEGAVKLGKVTVSRGEVVSLDDQRFSPERGRQGLFAPIHFAILSGYGVYFLEPYDPAKVPVLFVHGSGGNPQEFRAIIDRLDRRKFQPWVYQYPSGLRIDVPSHELVQALTELYGKHKFSRLFIVAHSMGGLVSRAAINEMAGRLPTHPLKLFIAISTPWDGVNRAKLGVDRSPLVIPNWIDLAPNSPFLQRLFEKRLPPQVPSYLLFGVAGGDGTDGVVPLISAVSLRAQAEAARVYAFPETHTSILKSPVVIDRLNSILEEHRRHKPDIRRTL
jgi:pimeloyl-ACP methyl ester carboxylesterase